MKAFRFRLEQALRWRCAQADLEKSRTAAVAARVSAVQTQLESRRNELSAAARDLAAGAPGAALESWTAYSRRLRREIADNEKQLKEAERALGEQLRLLAEARRKVRLLENLKQSGQADWNAELDRELEAFAGEAFLIGYNRESRRARSSGG